jgi:hypothetical protein
MPPLEELLPPPEPPVEDADIAGLLAEPLEVPVDLPEPPSPRAVAVGAARGALAALRADVEEDIDAG